MNKHVRDALEEAAVEFDERAIELEENEEGVYTKEDIKAQRDRAAYLRSLADKGDLYQCGNCGHTLALPRYAATLTDLTTQCSVCNTENSYEYITYSSGYDAPHLVNLWVRAHDLEWVAGIEPVAAVAYAIHDHNLDDADSLRRLAAAVEARLRELNVIDYQRRHGQRE